MKKIFFIISMFCTMPVWGQPFSAAEVSDWKARARRVTIIRDSWGIPHIYGKSDADAVFGVLYAQCEDDFERVERNYLTAGGRLAEAEGEQFIYQDLRSRLFIDSTIAVKAYLQSPARIKLLCDAFAAGVNYFLYTHPQVKPKLLYRFHSYMPFLFSEGSIGGDIESVSLSELKKFYGDLSGDLKQEINDDGSEPEPRGSNGFAIAPSRTENGNALFLINPHTSFYFRSELHAISDEGLNAYGAVTWGQFFIYQGFNEHCGWMHTSSAADVIDEYLETVVKRKGKLFYQYGKEFRPLPPDMINIRYKSGSAFETKAFTVYHTHHGPIVAERSGKWMAVKLMVEPLKALTQSYQRTKSNSLSEFTDNMKLLTNSSNNTVYADDKGNIAYWHGDFMPKRDPKFNWEEPVEGNNPETEWKGLHRLEEIVQIHNPPNGWIQNCNSTPFTAAGKNSPSKDNYPSYMAPDLENTRGIHAQLVLEKEKAFTLDKLILAAYDSYLPGFQKLLPAMLADYDQFDDESLKSKLDEPIRTLRGWDMRFSTQSIATTLAVFWAQKLRHYVASRIPTGSDQLRIISYLERETTLKEKVMALNGVIDDLTNDFGSWRQPWGEMNCFQRLTGKIEPLFDDSKASVSVPFTSSFWGSLASFGSKRFEGTKKMYGYVGNSFVAVVEFGKKVKAKSIVTGGSSSLPESSHFNDQSLMYAEGKFKDIWFYKEDLLKHVEKTYHPGE